MSGTTPKVAREVAEADFERMCAAYRIDLDLSDLDDEGRAEFAATRDKIVRLMMRGTVVVGADGNPTYTVPGSAKGYTFHPPTGATLMALETHGAGKNISNSMAAIADMVHTDKSEFAKMDLRDYRAISTLGGLFLADR